MRDFTSRRNIPVRLPLRRKLVLICVVGLAVWLPRGFALDRFVTVDEPSWLTFSANFYHALARGDFARTYQIVHPGVTTTWAGTAAYLLRYPAYAADAPGQVDWIETEVGPFLRAHGSDPIEVLAAGRSIVVLAITVTLTVAAVAAARLLGFWAALLGFLLIAGDPFHIALSRVLHVDALVSSFMLLSLLAFLNYLYGGRHRFDLGLSAVAAGLAWLTKVPAFFLIPFIGGLLLYELVRRARRNGVRGEDVRHAAAPLAAWGAAGLLVFVVLWPAMWVDPLATLRRVVGETLWLGRSGHLEAPLFFNGAIVQGDPGWSFYPVTYLWRTTPVVLIGLALAGLSLALPRARLMGRRSRRVAAVLGVFALSFMLLMTLGGKKFDRYLLPVYGPLDLVAGIGWLAAARWLQRRSTGPARAGAPALVGLAVAGQMGAALPTFPYYFSYYNPLLGGAPRAPEVMMIGWGEGLDQAARHLNALPDPERLRVATWFWNGTFSYFFKGHSLPGRFAPDTATVRQWLDTDYCVIYINQRQRGRLPRELLEYLDGLEPAKVVRIQGLDYAYVYDLRTAPFPAHLLGAHTRSALGSDTTNEGS
jgi:hypothetical protein